MSGNAKPHGLVRKDMNKLRLIAIATTVAGCTDVWSATGRDGLRLEKVEPVCREQARASAIRQLPFDYDRDRGAAGTPPIDRHDIERRETARCLQDKGFTYTREWR